MAIITISRGSLSGGQRLAECIAERLGYRCINREVLAETARQYGTPQKKLYEALTKKPGFLERMLGEKARYLAYIRAVLCKEAQNNNIVYHGYAGHLLLEGVSHIIKVRVVANMEFRIKVAMERHQLNRGEAIELIKKVDEERARWTRFLYHVDWEDPSLYDVVLNLDRFSFDGACEVVCQMTGMEQYQTTLESQKVMDDLVLSSYLKAIIATHKEISDGNLDIEAHGDVITIWGTVGSLIDADRVKTIVQKVPGVNEIDSKMRVRLPVFTSNGL